MKKVWIVLVSLLLITGCNKENKKPEEQTPQLSMEERFNLANSSATSMKNFKMKVEANIEIPMEGATMNMSISGTGLSDIQNKNGHYDINVEVFGMTMKMDTYYTLTDKQMILYMNSPTDGTWAKQTTVIEDDPTSEMPDFNKTIKKREEIKEENRLHYRVYLDGELLGKLMQTVEGEFEGKITDDVILDIYLNDNNTFQKIEGKMNIKTEESTVNFNIMMEFLETNTNETVTIPDDVIKNAIEQTDDENIPIGNEF